MPNIFPMQVNPMPLGLIAPTAGTPLSLMNYLQNIAGFADAAFFAASEFNVVSIQALPGNAPTNYVYILSNGSAADTVHYSNVLAVLTPGSTFNNPVFNFGSVSLNQIWIDVVTTGGGAIAFVKRQ